MKFATLPNGEPDGRLHVVSRDLTRAAPARAAETLQAALENWTTLEATLAAEYKTLNDGGGTPFDPSAALAPLPRAWQWLDGSAFESHGNLMDKVFGMQKKEPYPKPLMYQGVSDAFYRPDLRTCRSSPPTTELISRASSASSPTPCRSTPTRPERRNTSDLWCRSTTGASGRSRRSR